jgi:hypothetical protein
MRAMRLAAESMEKASALRGDGVGWQGDENLQAVSGGTPFGGGNRGLLTGDVCFVEAGTTSVRTIKKCEQHGIIYANYLNVAPRDFKLGFPGVGQRTEWFAIDFRGEFEVARSGVYEFNLLCDDGAILWIDGQELIDNDGLHEPTSRRGNVRLTAGKHRIRVHYLQGPREAIALQLFVTPPDGSERLFSGKF